MWPRAGPRQPASRPWALLQPAAHRLVGSGVPCPCLMCLLRLMCLSLPAPARPAAERCPFGVTCRWASKHANPDELTRQFVIEARAQAQQEAQQQEGQGQQAAAQQPGVPAQQPSGEGQADGLLQQAEAGEGGQADWWWRRDGTIPAGVQALPASAVPPVADVANTLSKDLQLRLRWAAVLWRPC